MKNEDRIVELLTELVQKVDQLESKLSQEIRAVRDEVGSVLQERMATNQTIGVIAGVVAKLIDNNQVGYNELSEKVRCLEEKVYGQDSIILIWNSNTN